MSKTKGEPHRTESWLDVDLPTLATDIEEMRFPISFIVANTWGSKPEDIQNLLGHLGISREQAEMSDCTMSGTQFKAMMELGLDLLQDSEPLSFIVGDGLSLGALGVYGFAMMAAENLADALDVCSNYSTVVMPALVLDRCFVNKKPAVIVRGHSAFGKALPAMVEITVKLMRNILDLTEMPIRLDSLQFAHEAEFPTAMYEEFYGCSVMFGSDENRIVFDEASLDVAFKHRNPAAAQLLKEQLLQNFHAMHSQRQWTLKVQAYIRDHLGASATLSRDDVAASLNITAKTLARRLQNEGTNFRQVADDLRRDMALYAIKHTRKSIAEISYEVGFSDVRAFRRALIRWTGMSAASFRAETD